MRGRITIVRSSVLSVDAQRLWDRVTSSAGVNDELGPYLTMRLPGSLADAGIASAPVRQPLGRAWILVGGVLPVEADDLSLQSVDAPRRFHERSSMLTAQVWEHERTLEAVGSGATRLTDVVTVVPRRFVPRPVVGVVVAAVFTHRHRRLRRRFGRAHPHVAG